MPAAAPTFVPRSIGATAVGDAGVPLVERDLVFTHGEGLRDRDRVLRPFILAASPLAFRRSHQELAGRNGNDLGARRTIPEELPRSLRQGDERQGPGERRCAASLAWEKEDSKQIAITLNINHQVGPLFMSPAYAAPLSLASASRGECAERLHGLPPFTVGIFCFVFAIRLATLRQPNKRPSPHRGPSPILLTSASNTLSYDAAFSGILALISANGIRCLLRLGSSAAA